jgi:signal peptidase I
MDEKFEEQLEEELEKAVGNEFEEPMEEDYQIESISIRKTLRFRVTSGIVLIVLFLLLRELDVYSAFNPINSFAFTLITLVILIYCIVVLFVDYSTNKNEYHKKEIYKRYKTLNNIYDYFSVIPYLMAIFTVLNMFVFSFSPISGSSMEPNYSDNEAVVFSHLTATYDRFDVVIVYVEEFDEPYLIKRVIGLPGETVVIDNNVITIEKDGVQTRLEQEFIDTDTVKTICYNHTDTSHCSWTLGEEEYFVLGDNRDGNGVNDSSSHGYSLDSRKFDEVKISEIYGKVVFKFKDFNILK